MKYRIVSWNGKTIAMFETLKDTFSFAVSQAGQDFSVDVRFEESGIWTTLP